MKQFLLFGIITAWTSTLFAASEDIRINQIGYYPAASKTFVVVNTAATTFDVKNSSGTVVYTGNLGAASTWAKSGEDAKIGDFTSFDTEGEYTISVSDKGDSYNFDIKDKVLDGVMKASLKGFYYQRASFALDATYAGEWSRAAGHADDNCSYHASSGHSSGTLSSPKGWYDAGDYGKYVVNAGISVGTMLQLHELHPSLFADNLNIPESNNGISDLLDEVKFEIDWLLTMQDSDGGVFFKLTTLNFAAMVLPEKATATRYIIGKSTTSTLDFAGMLAMAGRIYKDVDAAYATKCTEAAKKAWVWAKANPSESFSNPSDVKTGGYGDSGFKDEFFWAAAELLITTKDVEYKTYIASNLSKQTIDDQAGWGDLTNLAYFSLSQHTDLLETADADIITSSIIEKADELLTNIESSPYRIPSESFWWGGNSAYLNQAIVMAYAYKLSGDVKYLKGVIETNDYVLGKNATGYSFVTGHGDKTPMHPHHRPSAGDKIAAPVPGLLAGGVNSGKQDEGSSVVYPSDLAAKSYVDDVDSYASNEIAINWNAPLVFVTGFIEANTNGSTIATTIKEKHSDKMTIFPNPATSDITIKSSLDGDIVILDLNENIVKEVVNGSVSIGELPKGVYVGAVKNRGKIIASKYFYKH